MIDRIVILNDISAPKGGATALALLSIREFRKRGYAVTLLTGDSGDNQALIDSGVDIVGLSQQRLGSASAGRALATGLYNRQAGRMVTKWIAANDTPGTVYHLHGWAQILSPAVFRALEPVNARLILHAHDFFLACPNGSFSFLKTGTICPLVPMSSACVMADCDRRNRVHKVWRVVRHALLSHVYDQRRSPPILAIHQRMAPFLERAGIPPSAITTLPNPVTPFLKERVRAEHNREALFVGRLEATKGPDLAAAACRAANVTLRLVGDGELRARLEAEYPEMIFMGHQTPDAIAGFAASSRMLLMPSRYPEPYGLVAVEAAWSGLPVLATDTAFLTPDLVEAGAGVAIDPRDTMGFGRAIQRLASDDDLTQSMSTAAFDNLHAVALSPDAWTERLLEIYAARLPVAA